jgi:hypothetical protein
MTFSVLRVEQVYLSKFDFLEFKTIFRKLLYFPLREWVRGYSFFGFEVLHRGNDAVIFLPHNNLVFLRVTLSFWKRRWV